MNNEVAKNLKDMTTDDFYNIINSKGNNEIKDWLAKLGSEKINEMLDPSLTIERVIYTYRKMGYSEEWIENKLISSLKEKIINKKILKKFKTLVS